MTFSIVAADPAAGEVGVAVASKVLAVGVDTAWAAAGVGAVVTQALANTKYGPAGLRLLRRGDDPTGVVSRLTSRDPAAPYRQLGVVNADGRSATFTGAECDAWAGGVIGEHFACQGNYLVGEETVAAMARTFTQEKGDLAARLVAALAAGDRAGGDRRGRQSAALLVTKPAGGYLGQNDLYISLRVDDHATPVAELIRLPNVWRQERGWFPLPNSEAGGGWVGHRK